MHNILSWGDFMAVEIELKFSIPENSNLENDFPTFTPIDIENHYYDTENNDLYEMHWSYRIRIKNGIRQVTLKTPTKEKNQRNEWECDIRDNDPIKSLISIGAPSEISNYNLVHKCSAVYQRRLVLIENDSFKAELCIDRGYVTAKNKKAPLYELELELINGSLDGLKRYADSLCERYGLKEDTVSKHKKALNILKDRV